MEGVLFNRRTLLKSSAGTTLTSLIPAIFVPTGTPAQVEETAAIVTAAAGVISALVSIYSAIASYNFDKTNLSDLNDIENLLKGIDAKIDTVINLLEQLPMVMQQLLTDNDRSVLSSQIIGAEGTIFQKLNATHGGITLSASNKQSIRTLADTQNSARIALNAFGIIGYPYVARAFASESVALRSLKTPEDKDTFQAYKADTISDLTIARDQFTSLGLTERQNDNNAHKLWLSSPSRFFLGSITVGINYYVEIVGPYAAGTLSPSKVTDGTGTVVPDFGYGTASKTENNLKLPLSPFLPYPGYPLNGGQLAQRLAIVERTLQDTVKKGLDARNKAGAYEANGTAAGQLVAIVQALEY